VEFGEGQYGNSIYGQVIEDLTPEDLTPNLMAYIPTYYHNSRVMKALLGSMAQEIGLLKWAVQDTLRQFFVDTATWALDLWEQELGIEIDRLKNYLNRREVIKARLRGYGTTTVDMLKTVAAAYSGGEVDIIEYPAEYRFVVKFTGTRGIPPNMQDLANTIGQVKPAHLAFSFAYTFLVWQEATAYTWAAAGTKTWNEFRNLPPT